MARYRRCLRAEVDQGDKLKLAKEFQAYFASKEGCEAQTEGAAPTGPYLVKGCTLPTDVPPAVKDLQRYFDEGKATPALEFLSPVKGPALEQICIEVGSGIKSAHRARRSTTRTSRSRPSSSTCPAGADHRPPGSRHRLPGGAEERR